MTLTKQHQAKPRRKHAPRRERGLPLTVWIIVVALFGVVTALIQGVLQGSALGFATSGFLAVCALGLWNWQRWAYFGLVVGIAIAAAVVLIGVLSGGTSPVWLVTAIVAGALTVWLVQPRLEEFR